ncbi:MAG: adenylyltransferase/cytidyltransferase family protein [Chlorobi bacterium]|nr:adenylyltransferase/cytidyltransferase family protein [Chlorobiota bacterium]
MNLINNPYFNQDIINKIGLFGGTFNPLHNGHIELAKNSIVSLNLDAVVFVPNYLSPFKSDQLILDDFHRFKMIELTLKNYINFLFQILKLKVKILVTQLIQLNIFNLLFQKKNLFY